MVLGVPRTAPDSVLFTTYNTLDLFVSTSAASRDHYRRVVETIRGLGTDVVAVQEIRADDQKTAQARLNRLAGDIGLTCSVPGAGRVSSRVALAIGPRGYHCGLLWRKDIEAVPGSLRSYGQGNFWHSLACVTLDMGGRPVRYASHHATPFGRQLRADENERLVAALRNTVGPPALVGADWNTESADRIYDSARDEWRLYEPADPYASIDWFDELIYQCEWAYDEQGHRSYWADRRPGDVLYSGGLHDAAAVLRAPWEPTVGHHPDDNYGKRGIRRRIDGIRVTGPVTGALRGYHVASDELARQASDHLPVTVEYLPAAIS